MTYYQKNILVFSLLLSYKDFRYHNPYIWCICSPLKPDGKCEMSGKLHFVSTLAISELWHSLSFNPENHRLTNAYVCQFPKILF